ncbi:hypothetical protein ACVWXS_004218 [Lysinibacillus sp. TE18511]
MSLRKRSIIGFTALNVLMIAILIIDLSNSTSLEWLATYLSNDHRNCDDNILYILCQI